MGERNIILIVDDMQINRIMLRKILSNEYQIIEAENGKVALELLKTHGEKIAAIILDLIMPVKDGFSFLESLIKIQAYKDIPVIVSTIDGDIENEKRSLELGVWDFITKPFKPEIIQLRLKNVIARSQIYMAEHDSLTGFYNKRKFFQMTRQMLDEHRQEKFILLRLDIDRFKLINSFFGVEEGDRLLCYMASVIGEFVKKIPFCTYGRIESDIFCICKPYNAEQIEFLVEEFRNKLIAYNPNYYIEISFGAYIINDLTLDMETMYDRASLAASQCKGKYMKYLAIYDDRITQALMHDQRIMNEMAPALEKGQFVVYFQPKYSLKTKKPYGAEALVRWQHPIKGLIPPNEFIPVFEKNGFICKLDFYVWERVCQAIHRWLREGLEPDPISVNVSRANLYNPNIVELLLDLVKKYEISPELLNLELTESAYMDNPQIIKKAIGRLQNEGFVILMDDFGSGYSSLSMLKDIVVDMLKIDMKFLPTKKDKGRSERILASIIQMAKWLDMPVIVEGVETKEQVAFLQELGCDYVQGYFFARPMTLEKYEKLIFGKSIISEHNIEEDNKFLMNMLWNANSKVK